MGARISKFLWLLGINEKIICSKSQVSTFTGSRNNGLKPALFLARPSFSQELLSPREITKLTFTGIHGLHDYPPCTEFMIAA